MRPSLSSPRLASLVRRALLEGQSPDARDAIAFFLSRDAHSDVDYWAVIAYDMTSLDDSLAGRSASPRVHSTMYLYGHSDPECNGARSVSHAFSASPGSGWGRLVYTAAVGLLGPVMPDRHSVSPAAEATWRSLIRSQTIVGTPLPDQCLGDEFHGRRGYENPALNMSYTLAGEVPAEVAGLVQRGIAHRAGLTRQGLLPQSESLLTGG